MLPYQEDGKKLADLLENLFEDELSDEDIVVMRKPFQPRSCSECCDHNYASYNT